MPTNTDTVLLHCCCAPCTLMPLDSLISDGWQVALYYYNPNIHPFAEYERRLEVLEELAQTHKVSLIVDTYNPDLWEQRVGILGGPYPLIAEDSNYASNKAGKQQRCSACYQLRFEALAAYGKKHSLNNLDTTLTISPYQYTQEVMDSLAYSAATQGVSALCTDWRSFYAEATQKSRELGMYRQNYCGCRYSLEEAQLERQARKDAKKRTRQLKHEI